MAVEIERKFLVHEPPVLGDGNGIVQGYLSLDPERTIRVRTEAGYGTVTIKGRSVGLSRSEFEYRVPLADAEAMLALCVGHPIEKTRHRVDHGRHTWEIDVFSGVNFGLVVAEIELAHEAETFDRPAWLGAEVSDDPRYLNACLAQAPHSTWK